MGYGLELYPTALTERSCLGRNSRIIFADEMADASRVIDGSGLGNGNLRNESKIFDNIFLIIFSALYFSAGLIFGGSVKTLRFGGAFLMASDGAGAVATRVLACIPAGPTVVGFGPADLWCGI